MNIYISDLDKFEVLEFDGDLYYCMEDDILTGKIEMVEQHEDLDKPERYAVMDNDLYWHYIDVIADYNLMMNVSEKVDSEITMLRGMVGDITSECPEYIQADFNDTLDDLKDKAREALHDDYLTEHDKFQESYQDLTELYGQLEELGCRIAKYV